MHKLLRTYKVRSVPTTASLMLIHLVRPPERTPLSNQNGPRTFEPPPQTPTGGRLSGTQASENRRPNFVNLSSILTSSPSVASGDFLYATGLVTKRFKWARCSTYNAKFAGKKSSNTGNSFSIIFSSVPVLPGLV